MVTKQGYRKATLAEQFKIYEMLQRVLYKPEGSEFYVYKDGWDDEAVARTVNPAFSRRHTAFVRNTKFGALKGWSRNDNANETVTAASFAALQARVTRLESIIKRIHDDLGYSEAAE